VQISVQNNFSGIAAMQILLTMVQSLSG